ncbi:MAG: HAMP domain-containing histidine kinase [Lachnospiraceae bacterium]|nr:HAMP domain-containing histidine kinase [Lachnospiraceae bacterium]
MNAYRKRFVGFSMLSVGIVLFAAFFIIGFFFYHNQYEELKRTMSQVVEPISEPNGNFRPLFPRDQPSDRPEKPDFKPENRRDERIFTVFFEANESSYSVLGIPSVSEDVLEEAAKKALGAGSDFGRLRDYDLYFYCAKTGSSSVIAFADSSYLARPVWTMALLLGGIFLVLMTILFFLSRRLSAIALKPMEEARDMERRFVDDVSHDLKTPISVILANMNIVKQDPESSVSQESQWIDSTETAARRMLSMVNEMLTLSSAENRSKEPVLADTDLSAVIEKAVLQTESLAFEKKVELGSDIQEDLHAVTNPEAAERIAMSLIENALKYEPEGGTVRVALKSAKGKAVLTVENPGSVIPSDDLPHLFERFYRSDKSRSTSGGFGLGLSIVKALSDSVHARISAESDEKTGTRFTVHF